MKTIIDNVLLGLVTQRGVYVNRLTYSTYLNKGE